MNDLYCTTCGKAAQTGAAFCFACGTKLGLENSGTIATSHSARASVSPEADLDRLVSALALLSHGNAGGARTALEELLEERPDWAVARAYLGVAFLRLTLVADARVELERAVELAPTSFICRTKYAEFLARLGFYDKAVRELEIALDQAPPDRESRLAAIELKSHCKDKAKGIFYRQLAPPSHLRLRNLIKGRGRPASTATPNLGGRTG